jgi:superfamily II DNA or RNA helicase
MSYYLFEIPSVDGHHSDLVLADPDNPNAPAYSHYAFTIGTPANPNELTQRRGIPFGSFRDWEKLSSNFNIEEMLTPKKAYLPGGSVLEEKDFNPAFQANTAMRLGALELLANIFSGRITASDKDPFPHQLALQQHMKAHQTKVQRLLIADEVGLGKTIEVGLVLRDLLVAQGYSKPLRCLYLTKGGLLDDVRLKLQSVIPGVDGESIVQVEKSFVEYGNRTDGIHIASMDAARRYVKKVQKKKLPTGVKPEILIIDEAHHCASEDELTSPQRIGQKATTRAYEAAYQMITGEFWQDSAPPKLVIFMSATPFRSRPQFINLLRLLTHRTSGIENAYSPELTEKRAEEELSNVLGSDDSSTAVIWRQQDDVRSWSDKRLFPKLTIDRPPLQASNQYLKLIGDIREKVKEICNTNGESFGGFAIRQLETRLTSSTITGAMWLFRWCVRHQTWDNQKAYEKDASKSTKNLRNLIKGISQKLAAYDESVKSGHVTVSFPSDNFQFEAIKLGQPLPNNSIADIYRFSEKLCKGDEEDSTFTAAAEEIIELTELALKLLNFSDVQGETGVENAKLTWLKQELAQYPESKFLVFTESLQTCEIIIKALPRESDRLTGNMSFAEREAAVSRLRDAKSPVRVLVATSAADEGFDFQVANRVVHWDLSPSPAVLMQRNGRVARLGQIADVIAYYLIIAGTHEQRREKALVDRFTQLGITDERMRLKILGALSKEEEEDIFRDIEEGQFSLIDSILERAKSDQENMEKKLREFQTQLSQQWVISREELAKRLERWMELGLPSVNQKHELTFSTKEWSRPVFRNEGTVMETAQARIATIQARKFTFDPEFKVFGREKENILLAGLYPWFKNEWEGVVKHRPLPRNADPIGRLACSLARQRRADFTTISANQLYQEFPNLRDARYLLFVTHPLREVENYGSDSTDSYLTFYAFNSNLSQPINPKGAKAEDVYQLISLLEEDAIKLEAKSLGTGVLEASKSASQELAKWLETSRKLGGLTKKSYFLPIPVALISVLL